MPTANQHLTPEEEEFAEFSAHFDVELFCLEILHSRILEQAVREALERRHAAFQEMLEQHPDTIAEKKRWLKNREDTDRRMTRLRTRLPP